MVSDKRFFNYLSAKTMTTLDFVEKFYQQKSPFSKILTTFDYYCQIKYL